MNISQLEHAVEVIQCGSFSKAAEKRFMSPQALSKAVSGLEKELGVKLIERHGRGIIPTPAGLRFAQEASIVIRDFKNLKSSIREHNGYGAESVYRIAVMDSHYRGFLIREAFFDDLRDALNRKINLMYSSSESCLKAVSEGIAEGALILGKVDDPLLDAREVAVTWPGIVVGRNHPLIGQNGIGFQDLDRKLLASPMDLHYLRPRLIKLCAKESVHPLLEFVAPSIEVYKRFLASGGMFLTHQGSVLPQLTSGVFIPFLKENAFAAPYYYAVRRGHFDKAALRVLAFLRDRLA